MTTSLLARLCAVEGGEENGMDDKTLTALKGSIAKWEAIVAGTAIDEGIDNCPLCAEFYADECAECPVAERVGHIHCKNTPHFQWAQECSVLENHRGGYDFSGTPEALALAQKELNFLKSLLPEDSPSDD